MTTTVIEDRKTGKREIAVYAPNTKGNMRYHVNGVSMSDKAFNKKYKIVPQDDNVSKVIS